MMITMANEFGRLSVLPAQKIQAWRNVSKLFRAKKYSKFLLEYVTPVISQIREQMSGPEIS